MIGNAETALSCVEAGNMVITRCLLFPIQHPIFYQILVYYQYNTIVLIICCGTSGICGGEAGGGAAVLLDISGCSRQGATTPPKPAAATDASSDAAIPARALCARIYRGRRSRPPEEL